MKDVKQNSRNPFGVSDDKYNQVRKEVAEEMKLLKPELERQAKQRSKEFSEKHHSEINKIDVSGLENIPKKYTPLLPKEILFLNYINKRNATRISLP